MKLTPMKRSLDLAAVLVSVAMFSMGSVAYAQYGGASNGGSSAGSSAGTAGAPQKPGSDAYDILEEPVDTGYVDQEKREGRSTDPASPSPDSHVPKYPLDKEGRPIKDPEHLQGGPIGPN